MVSTIRIIRVDSRRTPSFVQIVGRSESEASSKPKAEDYLQGTRDDVELYNASKETESLIRI
eukprot:scaffold38788_cov221-Amphora_coffeaeformis.AAC.7